MYRIRTITLQLLSETSIYKITIRRSKIQEENKWDLQTWNACMAELKAAKGDAAAGTLYRQVIPSSVTIVYNF